MNQQAWDEAIAAFDGAIQRNASYSVAYYHKARAQIAAGYNDAARATLAAGMTAARNAGDWHAQSEMQDLLDSIA